MYRLVRYIIIPIIIAVVGYIISIIPQNNTQHIEYVSKQQAYVTKVIDGDTIEVSIDGKEYKVRYIGIDTPETVNPNKPVEYYGKEASNENQRLVLNKTVYLEKDVSDTDKYGRLLRYVYLDSSTMVNYLLVRNGFAYEKAYTPDVKYLSLFIEAETYAKTNNLGLWNQ